MSNGYHGGEVEVKGKRGTKKKEQKRKLIQMLSV